jgi:hypothetical protein
LPHALGEASHPYCWLNTLDRVEIGANGATLAGVACDGGVSGAAR